jgi:hypothetical protein
MTSDEAFDREVRLQVYGAFIATGRAPSADYQAQPEVRQALRRLAAAHCLVLRPDGRVCMAMPFSDVPTPFSVTHGRGTWWANCAWDALGMGAVLQSDVDVETDCPDCHTPLHVSIRSRRLEGDAAVVHIGYPAHRWWEDIVATWGTILLFRSEEDVEPWCRRQAQPRGEIVPVQTMYRLARSWYADRAHPEWRPRTEAESQALLHSFGLQGSFWQLCRPQLHPQRTLEQAR